MLCFLMIMFLFNFYFRQLTWYFEIFHGWSQKINQKKRRCDDLTTLIQTFHLAKPCPKCRAEKERVEPGGGKVLPSGPGMNIKGSTNLRWMIRLLQSNCCKHQKNYSIDSECWISYSTSSRFIRRIDEYNCSWLTQWSLPNQSWPWSSGHPR